MPAPGLCPAPGIRRAARRPAGRRRRALQAEGTDAVLGGRPALEHAELIAADLVDEAGDAVLFVGTATDAALDLDEGALVDELGDLRGLGAEEDDPMPLGVLLELAVLALPAVVGGHAETGYRGPPAVVLVSGSRPTNPIRSILVLGPHGFLLPPGVLGQPQIL